MPNNMTLLEVNINGEDIAEFVPQDITLLDYLRNYRHLMGAKKACGVGGMRRLHRNHERGGLSIPVLHWRSRPMAAKSKPLRAWAMRTIFIRFRNPI